MGGFSGVFKYRLATISPYPTEVFLMRKFASLTLALVVASGVMIATPATNCRSLIELLAGNTI